MTIPAAAQENGNIPHYSRRLDEKFSRDFFLAGSLTFLFFLSTTIVSIWKPPTGTLWLLEKKPAASLSPQFLKLRKKS